MIPEQTAAIVDGSVADRQFNEIPVRRAPTMIL